MISLKRASNLYWKCLATSTGLLLYRLHRFCQLDFFSLLSLIPRLFNLLIIYRSSSSFRLAKDNVRKYAAVRNCLTITTTSYKKCFQYAGVPLN